MNMDNLLNLTIFITIPILVAILIVKVIGISKREQDLTKMRLNFKTILFVLFLVSEIILMTLVLTQRLALPHDMP